MRLVWRKHTQHLSSGIRHQTFGILVIFPFNMFRFVCMEDCRSHMVFHLSPEISIHLLQEGDTGVVMEEEGIL